MNPRRTSYRRLPRAAFAAVTVAAVLAGGCGGSSTTSQTPATTVSMSQSGWSPNEFDDYEFITFGYRDYVCEDAWLGSWGDKDCYLFTGGNPSRSVSGWVDLYCSGSGYSMRCDPDDYPSVWDDYVILTIDYGEYICDQGAFGDMPCVRYYGGSPSSYSFWSPDYYCDELSYYCEPGW